MTPTIHRAVAAMFHAARAAEFFDGAHQGRRDAECEWAEVAR